MPYAGNSYTASVLIHIWIWQLNRAASPDALSAANAHRHVSSCGRLVSVSAAVVIPLPISDGSAIGHASLARVIIATDDLDQGELHRGGFVDLFRLGRGG